MTGGAGQKHRLAGHAAYRCRRTGHGRARRGRYGPAVVRCAWCAGRKRQNAGPARRGRRVPHCGPGQLGVPGHHRTRAVRGRRPIPLVPAGRGLQRGGFEPPEPDRLAPRAPPRPELPPWRPPLPAPRPVGVPLPSATSTNLQHLPNGIQTNEEGRSTFTGATLFKNVRQRPTLPHGPPCSTIGAEGLNFRVRNGTGCFPFAITAETLLRCHRPLRQITRPERRPYLGNRIVDAKHQESVEAKPLGLLVPVSCTRCRASTSGLSTQSSSWGPYLVNPEGDLILRRASRLDAFSGYPFRT